MKRTILLFVAILLCSYLLAYAPIPEFPKQISYQAMLTESDGTTPVADAKYPILFEIYNAFADGDLKWSHTYNVPVTNGLMNTVLGDSGAPIELPFDEEYWLEITVDGGDPLPRIKLTSVGYAYRALVADSAKVAVTSESGGGWVDDGTKVRLETISDRVGIGTTDPFFSLTVAKTGWDGIMLAGDNTHDNLFMLEQDAKRSFVFQDQSEGNRLTIESSEGLAFNVNGPNKRMLLDDYSIHGGALYLFDEAGNWTCSMQPDVANTGGWFGVMRSTIDLGFTVDGNGASNEPIVTVDGSVRDAIFNMSVSGNSSVQLPADAIYDYEILDEPGVASDKEGSGGVTLDNTWKTILSRTINCPTSGYVLVIGTAQPYIYHTYNTESRADFGVSASSSSPPDNQDMEFRIHDKVPSGTFSEVVTTHGLFSVGSGSKTFYFLAKEHYGDIVVYDRQLTLIFFPTAYGTVEPTLVAGEQDIPDGQAPKDFSITAADVLAEQAEAEAFNAARLKRELAEIRARVETLEREVEQQNK